MQLIDTFDSFITFWDKSKNTSLDNQIDLWASDYMSCWPELLEKQIDDYANQNVNWRTIAKEKVFPFLEDIFPAMQTARTNLLELCPIVERKLQTQLGVDLDFIALIYVGIGCGAGWVTLLQDKSAVLFGLENISECKWVDMDSIEALIAHEFGHLVHCNLRKTQDVMNSSDPWMQLYCEGFAKRCEHLLLDRKTWNEAVGINRPDWLVWCKNNKARLASMFLQLASEKKPVRPFFGHWYHIEGRKQCGYFFGCQVIRELEKTMTIKEIAVLDDIEKRCKDVLVNMIDGNI